MSNKLRPARGLLAARLPLYVHWIQADGALLKTEFEIMIRVLR